MTIQYASDLHLDFRENKTFLLKHTIQPMGDILILAGDIVTFAGMKYHNDFFDYLSANFKTVYWVPGNHEYYHSDINCKVGSFCEAIRHNLFLVNNTTALHGDVKLIFSTMLVENQSFKRRLCEDAIERFPSNWTWRFALICF